MAVAAPLELHRETVRPEWIDYNGHMNVAYYVLAFDHATDAFFQFVGVGENYAAASNSSTFAAEAHITYQREVLGGAPLRFTSQLLGFDSKRLHYITHMYHADEGYLAATIEWISLHVDLTTRRVSPWPEAVMARLAEIMESHQDLPRPAEVGRVIAIPKPRAEH